jgi:hypothetical protein
MPIRRDLRTFYRGPWLQVRLRILARARHRCEQCKVPNHQLVDRGPNGVWRSALSGWAAKWHDGHGQRIRYQPLATRQVRIVLTVAHLNHIAGDDRDENLLALCQWCHLNYDKLHHKETRSARKDAARPLLDQIPMPRAAAAFGEKFEALGRTEI